MEENIQRQSTASTHPHYYIYIYIVVPFTRFSKKILKHGNLFRLTNAGTCVHRTNKRFEFRGNEKNTVTHAALVYQEVSPNSRGNTADFAVMLQIPCHSNSHSCIYRATKRTSTLINIYCLSLDSVPVTICRKQSINLYLHNVQAAKITRSHRYRYEYLALL